MSQIQTAEANCELDTNSKILHTIAIIYLVVIVSRYVGKALDLKHRMQ